MVDPRWPRKRSHDRIPAMDDSIVDFDHPPVSEVICGIGFKELSGFEAPQMGLFWNAIRSEFPIAEGRGPIVPPGGEFTIELSPETAAPIRFFLRSKNRAELVQVQSNRLLYNWLKTESGNPYPRFRGVIKRFRFVRRRFERFLKANSFEAPAIRELRLEYLNNIPSGEGWKNLGDLSKLFPDFRYRRRNRRDSCSLERNV